MLHDELCGISGVSATLTDAGYLIGRLPATAAAAGPTIGFIAHVDTTEEVPSAGVVPQIHEAYDGNTVELGGGVVLDPADDPRLLHYRGRTLITADGTTLLGADDKAGIAEIVTAVDWLASHPEIPHGEIEVAFTPDEETGRGMDGLPRDMLSSRCCYTLDGDEEGTIESECFNALKVDVTFGGISMHTGTARGKLVNAVSMAGTFLSMLPRNESPEATDGRYGFYFPLEVRGTAERSELTVYLRDFEKEEMGRRLEALQTMGRAVESIYPGGTVGIEPNAQYSNMRDSVAEDPPVVELLLEAIRRTGMEPRMKEIRGGTDGARLSEAGIPTPNIFTGGHNYHSRREWAAVPAMVRAVNVIINLSRLWASRTD